MTTAFWNIFVSVKNVAINVYESKSFTDMHKITLVIC